MTIAAQLRVAIALLIAALSAILLAAFYVPSQLQHSANEKYVEDAIPLRAYVQDLALQIARQQAAVESFLRTREPVRLQRYHQAIAATNADLAQMGPYLERHPQLKAVMQKTIAQIAELQGAFEQQIAALRQGRTGGAAERERRANRASVQISRATDRMIEETESFVAEVEQDQSNRYTQLLVVLASLGALALGIGLALFLLVPRRLGQLYAAEQQSRREAESRAEAARALAHVSDGVILTDPGGRVRFWNPAAEKHTGIDEAGATGRELARLLPGWERLTRQAQSGLGGAAVLPIHVGHERWLSVTSTDFGDGVVYAVRDVTEERGLETLRSDFVATASHELRTPMTSISGAARTLLRHGEQLPPERHQDFLEMIVAESDRLSRIVDQILVASRIEAGKIEVAFERCDATEIARSVVEAAKLRAPSGIEIHLDATPPQEVDCDPDRLRQILGNIIDNAIKYSPDGGDVRVELRPEDERVRFVVQDEGMGFDQSAADAIFDRFHRLDPHQTRGIGGTGLGLYIARELVRRMGGRIWAESERGRGASFSFELPRVRAQVRAS